MIRLVRFESATQFLEATEGILLANEAMNSLLIGLAERLASDDDHNSFDSSRRPYYANVFHSDTLLLSVLRTPPHRLVLAAHAELPLTEVQQIVESLANDHPDAPGLTATKELSDLVGRRFAKCFQKSTTVARRDGLYKLTSVVKPRPVAGECRIATTDDLETVLNWAKAFELELLDKVMPGSEERLRARMERNAIYAWDTGDELTSMAVRVRTSKHSASIGLVYTPPALRGHGYASNVVAGASQDLLDEGYQFCTLFTDLTNPISNDIYQKIGYEWVCEFTEMDFN